MINNHMPFNLDYSRGEGLGWFGWCSYKAPAGKTVVTIGIFYEFSRLMNEEK